MSMDNNRVGDNSEMKVAADLSAVGDISLPVGQPAYDLIADVDGDLYRIQVKTSQRTGQRNETLTVWFDRSAEDFRPCNRGMTNIAEEMTFHDTIESLKSK